MSGEGQTSLVSRLAGALFENLLDIFSVGGSSLVHIVLQWLHTTRQT